MIHDYTTDEKGLVTDVNLIVATVQNNAAMNMGVKSAAQALIKNGQYDETVLNEVEMVIRAYDPCLSCASHSLDGRIGVKIDIQNAAGETIDTLTNQ